MSKVNVSFPGIRETFKVAPGTVVTGWLAGQLFKLDSGGLAVLGSADSAIFVAVDPSSDLASPPTGSLLTGMHGAATLSVSHAPEIAEGIGTRCYESDVESAAIGALLYASGNGKWTTVATGSNKGTLIEVPASGNSRTIGILLRM